MRSRALLRSALVAALLLLPLGVAAQPEASPSGMPDATVATSQDAVVRGVFFFSPTCPHCEYVITEELPGIFDTWGDGFTVSYDESLPAEDLAFFLMGNEMVQLLMVDTSTRDGAQVFSDDSSRLGLDRAGVPRLDVADRYLVGSADIPARFPGIIADGLATGGIDWPPVAGIDAPLAWFTSEGLLAPGDLRSEPDAAAAAALTGSGGQGPLDRIGDDPVGNTIAIAVLVALVASLVAVPVLAARGTLGPLPTLVVPVLTLGGLVIAGYLASIETSGSEAVCGPVGDCNAVQQSEYASPLGVPIGVLGVIGYLAIGGSWLVSRLAAGRSADVARVLMALGAFGGVLFSTYLTFLEPFVIGATCMWCISSALIMLALLWVTAGDGWSAYQRLRGSGPGDGRRRSGRASASMTAH